MDRHKSTYLTIALKPLKPTTIYLLSKLTQYDPRNMFNKYVFF